MFNNLFSNKPPTEDNSMLANFYIYICVYSLGLMGDALVCIAFVVCTSITIVSLCNNKLDSNNTEVNMQYLRWVILCTMCFIHILGSMLDRVLT